MPLVSTTFDVAISDEETGLVVIGPPATVDVAIDIGPEGERGSQAFSGSNPNSFSTSQFQTQFGLAPKYNDLYIRTDAGSNFGTFYSYTNVLGIDQWEVTISMQDVVDEYFYQNPTALENLANSASAYIIDITQDYLSGSAGITFYYDVDINQNLDVIGNISASGTLTVGGNPYFKSTTLTMNSDETVAPSQNVSFVVERGTANNVDIRWNESTDKWQWTNDGTSYSDFGQINQSEVFAVQLLMLGS